MQRQPNRVKKGAAVSICRSGVKVGKRMYKSLCPSKTGEEHPHGPMETAVEVSNGSDNANLITSGTADYGAPAFQADELSMEIATPPEEFSGVTEAEVKVVVDEGLIHQPTPRRTNPTTVILPKLDLENAIEYQASVLYKNQRGEWVAEPLPEKTAERVAQTVPTYRNNGVLDLERVALA